MRKKRKSNATNGTSSDWLTPHGQGQAPAGFGSGHQSMVHNGASYLSGIQPNTVMYGCRRI